MIDFGAEKGMITQKQQEALASVVQTLSPGGHLLAVLDSYPVAQKLIAEVASPWGLQVEKTISPEGDLDKL
jgi:cystathionine beta-lyase/cystathionine gamma-synthase